MGHIKGDTESLDYGSYGTLPKLGTRDKPHF